MMVFKVILGLFGAIFLKWPVTQQNDCRRMKRSEIWDALLLVVEHIWGTVVPVVFDVILWSFGAFVSRWPISREKTVAKRIETLELGYY